MKQEILKIEQEQKDIAIQVSTLVVKDQESYESGALIKITLSTFRKKLNLFFDPMLSKAKAAYDEVRGTRDKILNPTKELEDTVKGKLKTYERKMEQEAAEAKRKADKERQEKIDAETKERQDKADQAVKDEAALFGGDTKNVKAEKVEEVKPEEVDVEQPLPTIDKVKGLGFKKVWNVEIIDKAKIPIEFMDPNMVTLRAKARVDQEKYNVPGTKARYE